MICLPLNIPGASGAPTRVLLVSTIDYSLLQNFIYYPISFPPMRGERIQVRNFEEVGSLLKSEKDPMV
ncbi:MAG: hypothetical protein ACXQTK_02485, partial [Candidatus Syntropharchaeales archaeon]